VFSGGASRFCDFIARVSFFAGSATARLALTVRNPRRARHRKNLWDLGDAGSVYIRDLALQVNLVEGGPRKTIWSAEPGAPFADALGHDLEIFQDSSGGPNWHSQNHVNRQNRVATSFCGYRVRSGEQQSEGRRAHPLVAVFSGGRGVAGAVQDFWQNFPKSIEVSGFSLIIRLFPHQYADLHELQGGEQKTHVVYLSFLGGTEDLDRAAWVRDPLVPHATPEWYSASGAIPYLTSRSEDANTEYLGLVDAAVEGNDSFENKREIIDEYGWRHFGDIYGDHESVHYTGQPPVISHYNNQYDAVYGAFIQLTRSGDERWFRMMDQLASHVVDIDVYHTTEDKPGYNHGLFWHTSHYTSAFTGTHRSYSTLAGPQSGGPSAAHCYTTGLMYHFFATGDERSRETVIGLARWVLDLDDGNKNVLRWLDSGHTGDATISSHRSDPPPTRAGANAVVALLDGFALSGDRRFLDKAEALIGRCIHPSDNIESLDLIDAERQWSYTMFLQALGLYLDVKAELGEVDVRYAYARESLLHYARWMAERETPYLTRASRLEYPTETWSAQDMRKSDIFKFAVKHSSGAERKRFAERLEFFFRSSVGELTMAKTRSLSRPVVLMMTCGYMHAYFRSHPAEAAPSGPHRIDFGRPERFVSQRSRVVRKLGVLAAAALTAGIWFGYWLSQG